MYRHFLARVLERSHLLPSGKDSEFLAVLRKPDI